MAPLPARCIVDACFASALVWGVSGFEAAVGCWFLKGEIMTFGTSRSCDRVVAELVGARLGESDFAPLEMRPRACSLLPASPVLDEMYELCRSGAKGEVDGLIFDLGALASKKACELFGAKHVDVRFRSPADAALAAVLSAAGPGSVVMGLALDQGGLGYQAAPSGIFRRLFDVRDCYLDPLTETLDYDFLLSEARKSRPKAIVMAGSVFGRIVDFEAMGSIAKEVGAFLVADVSQTAGLVAVRACRNPLPYIDVAVASTHETLRGPLGCLAMTDSPEVCERLSELAPPIESSRLAVLAAAERAIALFDAASTEFGDFMAKGLGNAKALGEGLQEGGLRLVSGGTDALACVADVSVVGITGAQAQASLLFDGVLAEKGLIPYDRNASPATSGICLGALSATALDFDEEESRELGLAIAKALTR